MDTSRLSPISQPDGSPFDGAVEDASFLHYLAFCDVMTSHPHPTTTIRTHNVHAGQSTLNSDLTWSSVPWIPRYLERVWSGPPVLSLKPRRRTWGLSYHQCSSEYIIPLFKVLQGLPSLSDKVKTSSRLPARLIRMHLLHLLFPLPEKLFLWSGYFTLFRSPP